MGVCVCLCVCVCVCVCRCWCVSAWRSHFVTDSNQIWHEAQLGPWDLTVCGA